MARRNTAIRDTETTTLRRPRAGDDRTQSQAASPQHSGSAGATAVARRDPTPEEIRRRAYEIYLSRRGVGGSPESDWLQAERELRAR